MRKLILLCGLIISVSSNAQTKGSAVVLRVGYAHTRGAEKLYTNLTGEAITGFKDNFSLLGIEIYHRRNKWVAALEATAGAQKARPNGIYSLKPYNNAAHARIGYVVYEGKEWWFYPSAGIGVSMISLSQREKLLGKTTKIDDVHLYSPSFDFGLNLDLQTTKERSQQKRTGGLVLGIRAGYRFSIESSAWRNRSGERLNAAKFRNNSYYLTLVAGGGLFCNTRK
jgi:hypothetical protein